MSWLLILHPDVDRLELRASGCCKLAGGCRHCQELSAGT